MRRWEALACLCFALLLITAGVTWLFGPYGLVSVGVLLAVAVLLIVDLKEDEPR